jgi:hypothetical protein
MHGGTLSKEWLVARVVSDVEETDVEGNPDQGTAGANSSWLERVCTFPDDGPTVIAAHLHTTMVAVDELGKKRQAVASQLTIPRDERHSRQICKTQ